MSTPTDPRHPSDADSGDATEESSPQELHAEDETLEYTPTSGDPQTADNEVRPDNRIGEFRSIRLLGSGGMGEVFEAVQEGALRRRVALKLVRPGMDTDRVISRFESERQALAMMNHNNIARVFDAGTTDQGRPYFAMEYVEGRPITQFCDHERLTTKERIELFLQVCDGIQHAHQKGIIHRDLKPSNVLVSHEDGKATPKIIDFGIAKAMEQPLTEQAVATQQGHYVGTPAYMSPEQAAGSNLDIDTRSDVYALGVLLYEVLVGELPIAEEHLSKSSLDELRRAIQEDDAERPSTRIQKLTVASSEVAHQRGTDALGLVSQLRGDLDWIVMKALEKERDRRYDSAAGLGADIRRHLRDEPVMAGPPSNVYRVRKFVRRHKLGVAAGVLILFAIILGGILATTGLVRALRAERLASREAATSRQVTEFLVGLFDVADPREGRGGTVTAREILDEGAHRLRIELAGQDEIQATMMNTMGRVYLNLGLHDEALSLLEEAYQTRADLFGEKHPASAESLARVGRAQQSMADFANAEESLRQALEAQREIYKDDHPEIVESLTHLAGLRFQVGDMQEAEALARESLVMNERLPEQNRLALALNHQVIGNIRFASGDSAAAETAYREALSGFLAARGEEHLEVAQMMMNLAMALTLQGKAEQADSIGVQSHEMMIRLLGDRHPFVARTYMARAFVLLALGELDRAEAASRSSIVLHKELFGEKHPASAEAYLNLARVLNARGEFAQALPMIESSVTTYRALFPGDHWILAHAESVYGGSLSGVGRLDEAEPLLLASHEVLVEKLGDSFLTQEAEGRLVAHFEAAGDSEAASRFRQQRSSAG